MEIWNISFALTKKKKKTELRCIHQSHETFCLRLHVNNDSRYVICTGLCKRRCFNASSTVNHFLWRPIRMESSHSGNSSVTTITNTSVRCFLSIFRTSKMPRNRSNLPVTPASSMTSLTAVTLESSSGSTPPPGNIH